MDENGKAKFLYFNMKGMLSSLKEKKRYIVFEVLSEKKHSSESIKKAVNQGLRSFLGDLGLAKAGLIWVDCGENKGILRTSVKESDNIKAGLTLVKDINNEKALIKTIGTSGILNKAKERWY